MYAINPYAQRFANPILFDDPDFLPLNDYIIPGNLHYLKILKIKISKTKKSLQYYKNYIRWAKTQNHLPSNYLDYIEIQKERAESSLKALKRQASLFAV